MSEIKLVLQHLEQPEYVHVLLNPVPVYGTTMGILALLIALLMKSESGQLSALVVIFVSCATAWPVAHYGHLGYDRVYAMSYSDAQAWLDLHESRADTFKYFFYVVALAALTALLSPLKLNKATMPLTWLTLMLAIVAVTVGGWISHAGGQVRHSEFRDGPPPGEGGSHSHSHDIHDH